MDHVVDVRDPQVADAECDLCEQDLRRQLLALEAWGQAQRRDALDALLEKMPERMVRQILPFIPWHQPTRKVLVKEG